MITSSRYIDNQLEKIYQHAYSTEARAKKNCYVIEAFASRLHGSMLILLEVAAIVVVAALLPFLLIAKMAMVAFSCCVNRCKVWQATIPLLNLVSTIVRTIIGLLSSCILAWLISPKANYIVHKWLHLVSTETTNKKLVQCHFGSNALPPDSPISPISANNFMQSNFMDPKLYLASSPEGDADSSSSASSTPPLLPTQLFPTSSDGNLTTPPLTPKDEEEDDENRDHFPMLPPSVIPANNTQFNIHQKFSQYTGSLTTIPPSADGMELTSFTFTSSSSKSSPIISHSNQLTEVLPHSKSHPSTPIKAPKPKPSQLLPLNLHRCPSDDEEFDARHGRSTTPDSEDLMALPEGSSPLGLDYWSEDTQVS